jgi:cell wall-associated NlpC family hydrolase
VVSEALAWEGTPFHHQARVKGAGVDCGQLLLAAYQGAGLIPADYEPPPYAFQWHLHQTEEQFLHIIEELGGHRVDRPGPGDVAIWQMGKTYSHGAIVIAWPHIIHAAVIFRKVVQDDALASPLQLAKYPVYFYSIWESA